MMQVTGTGQGPGKDYQLLLLGEAEVFDSGQNGPSKGERASHHLQVTGL